MKIRNVNITGLKIIKTKMFYDSRGFFKEVFRNNLIKKNFKFDVMSSSKKNVIRGLHFQIKDKQTKFIYVIDGKILDVVINLKKKSPDFGKVKKFILKEGEALFIPSHYAHGYECLSNKCSVLYHLEKYRNAKWESGIKYNDNKFKIKWKTKKPILSQRDKSHSSFVEFLKFQKTL